MKFFLFVFLIFFSNLQAEVDYDLQKEILDMYEEDQKIRCEWIDSNFDPVFGKKVRDLDQLQLKRLKEIIQSVGWPGYQLVGEEGSNAMWLLVQHTPELEFQKICLNLLQQAVINQDASSKNLAYLEDRVLMHEGKKQKYGTQWKSVEGKYILYPVEDFTKLNERRMAVGLNSIEESKEDLMRIYHLSEENVLLEAVDDSA